MSIHVRPYAASDLPAMNEIWNEVVREGIAFPQLELLDKHTGAEFFAALAYAIIYIFVFGALSVWSFSKREI